jgi:polyhydroxyalkanoate synthase
MRLTMRGDTEPSLRAGFDVLGRSPFVAADILRRAQGNALAALGLGPTECGYRKVLSGTHWCLRDYDHGDASASLLVVAAPIKRPYIWDLCPSASAVRRLRRRLHVYLLEWLPASDGQGGSGIEEYVAAIAECVATMSAARADAKPFIVGHSLGGTLAAIFGSWAPERIRGLVLLAAPLCFEAGTSRFRDAIAALAPVRPDAGLFPGSLLSYISALASPETFIWSRLLDAAFSSGDHRAREVHARVERWTLDEVALPSRLVYQVIEWLYREDRLCRGTLKVGDATVGPSRLNAPTLAVVNRLDELAPLGSVTPFTEATATRDVRLIEYSGDVGVSLQHLAILIGRQAHARVWPEIESWLDSHA